MLLLMHLAPVISQVRILNISFNSQDGKNRVFLSTNNDNSIARAIEPSEKTLWEFQEFSQDDGKTYKIASNKDPQSLVLGTDGKHALLLKPDSPELRWVIHAIEDKKVILQLNDSCLAYHDSKFHLDECDIKHPEQHFNIQEPENDTDKNDPEPVERRKRARPNDESTYSESDDQSEDEYREKNSRSSSSARDRLKRVRKRLRESIRDIAARKDEQRQEMMKLLEEQKEKWKRELEDKEAVKMRMKPIIEKLKRVSVPPSTSIEKNLEFKTLLQPLRFMNTTVIKTVFTTKLIVQHETGTKVKTSTEFITLTHTDVVVVTDVRHIDEICTQTQVKNVVKTTYVTVPVSVTSVVTAPVVANLSNESSLDVCTISPIIPAKTFVSDEESSFSSSQICEPLSQNVDSNQIKPRMSFSGAIQKLFIQKPSKASEKYLNSPIQNQLNKIKSLKFLEKDLNLYTKNVMRSNIKVPQGLKNIFMPKSSSKNKVKNQECIDISTVALVNPPTRNVIYNVVARENSPQLIQKSQDGDLVMIPPLSNIPSGGNFNYPFMNQILQNWQRPIVCV